MLKMLPMIAVAIILTACGTPEVTPDIPTAPPVQNLTLQKECVPVSAEPEIITVVDETEVTRLNGEVAKLTGDVSQLTIERDAFKVAALASQQNANHYLADLATQRGQVTGLLSRVAELHNFQALYETEVDAVNGLRAELATGNDRITQLEEDLIACSANISRWD